MTLTDDTLVRDLVDLTDRALPPMSLDPTGVLAAGRRHQRHRTAIRSVGGLALAVVAVVGILQIGDGPTTEPPPADLVPDPTTDAPTVELATGVIAVKRPTSLTLDDGTIAADLGISFPDAPATSRPLILMPLTADELAEANASTEPHPVWDGGVQLAHVGESGPEPVGPPWVWSSAEAEGDDEIRWDSVMRTAEEESGLFFGILPAWLPNPRVVLYSQNGFLQPDGRTVHSLEVPVYAAPTDDGRLLYTVWIPAAADDVAGFLTDVDATLAISSDGRVVGGRQCSDMTLDECAGLLGPEIYAAAELVTGAIDTLRVETATDVRPVETSDGPGVDLGIRVGEDWDPQDEGLTYALRAGVLIDEDSRTPDEPGLWLVTLAPDGSTVTGAGAGGSVDEALAPANRNPIWSAGMTDHEAYLVGVRPPALEGATFELVLRADGYDGESGNDDVDERTPIPTFRVPGLDADVWFVALTDPAVRTDWRTAWIVVTAADGSTSMWNLAGQELKELTVAAGDH